MSDHVIRNLDHLDGCRRFRDVLRAHGPNGRDGLVLTDLDVLVRFFGPTFGLDALGRFGLLEIKHGGFELTAAQRWTFGLLDRALNRSADADRYLGFRTVEDYGDRWQVAGKRGTWTDEQLVAALLAWPGLQPVRRFEP